MPQALGKNHGGYCGETIDIDDVLASLVAEARARDWGVESLPVDPELNLIALHRQPKTVSRRFYLSTGVHGDEPAGPLAVQRMIEEDLFPDDAECWVLPCLNPTGFALNRRETAAGIDLNRDYQNPQSGEVQTQVRWLENKGRFDCAVCLHEDWEAKGFYLYAVNPKNIPCVSEAIVDAVRPVFPIDRSAEIEGFPACDGIIRPPVNPLGPSIWPETLYLTKHHTDLGYTLESSSDFPLANRVDALVLAVRALMNTVSPA